MFRHSAGSAAVTTNGVEPGTFTTDEPPTADTPAHGSTNAGINKLGANRTEPADDASGQHGT